MGKFKKFRDIEEDFVDEYIDEEGLDFKKLVRDAEKRRQSERKNKRREKRSYLDENENE